MQEDLLIEKENNGLDYNKLKKDYMEMANILNPYLSDENKIDTSDEAFDRRFNDPKEQRFYELSMKINERNQKQTAIVNSLKEKYGEITGEHPFRRNFASLFKAEDTKEARQYNEELYKAYKENPEAVVQHFFKKVIDFDFSKYEKIFDNPDYKNYLLEFELEHPDITSVAFVTNSAFDISRIKPSTYFSEYLSCFKGIMEILPSGKLLANQMDSYFSMPVITEGIMSDLAVNNFGGAHPDLMKKISNKLPNDLQREVVIPNTKEFFANLNNMGIDTKEPNFIIKYAAVENSEDGEKLVSVVNALKNPDNYSIYKLDEKYVNNIKQVTENDCAKDNPIYLNELEISDEKTRIEHMNKQIFTEYSLDKKLSTFERDNLTPEFILDKNKGGFFERFFETTSPEFRELRTIYRGFNNKNSKYYGDTALLRTKAKAYLDHKGVKNTSDIENLGKTGKGRSLFALTILENTKEEGILFENENFFEDNKELSDNLENDTNLEKDVIKNEDIIEDEAIDNSMDDLKK